MNITPKSRPLVREVVVKSLVVGFAYALANALAAAILGSMSRLAPTIDNLSVWFLTGILICLSLSPFIIHSSWTRSRTIFAAWAVLAFVRSLGLGIEGALFKPTAAVNAIVGAVFGLLVSLLVAWLSVLLLMPTDQVPPESTTAGRSWWGWTWRVLVVGLAYFVFYFVFGAANAFLYTLSFYKNNPQFWDEWEYGRKGAKLCLAHPEVADALPALAAVRAAAATRSPGTSILLCH